MELYKIRNKLNKIFYSCILKKICFMFDEEKVHNFFINAGKLAGRFSITRKLTRSMFCYQDGMLEQELLGIKFNNPVGLAAGFDKNALIISITKDIGFGFTEIGSVTAKPCMGNGGKRLLRIPERKTIWVNLGLNNNGSEKISSRLKGKKFYIPVGINIAKTNCPETKEVKVAVEDYIYTIKKFEEADIGDYYTINISCPSTYGGETFLDPKKYALLLREISILKIKKPIFVKLSPDLDRKIVDKLLILSRKYKINGFICTNLTKKNTEFNKGGLSGKEVSDKSNLLLSYVYKKTRDWKQKPILIGVGGIFSAEDAYKKIKLGANLVQLITGMIYEGPGIVGEINEGLVELLKKDNFSSVSEAVGSYSKS